VLYSFLDCTWTEQLLSKSLVWKQVAVLLLSRHLYRIVPLLNWECWIDVNTEYENRRHGSFQRIHIKFHTKDACVNHIPHLFLDKAVTVELTFTWGLKTVDKKIVIKNLCLNHIIVHNVNVSRYIKSPTLTMPNRGSGVFLYSAELWSGKGLVRFGVMSSRGRAFQSVTRAVKPVWGARRAFQLLWGVVQLLGRPFVLPGVGVGCVDWGRGISLVGGIWRGICNCNISMIKYKYIVQVQTLVIVS